MELEEFANYLGVGKSTVSNWENGHKFPSLTRAFDVSEKVGASVEFMFDKDKYQYLNMSNLDIDQQYVVLTIYNYFIEMNKKNRKQKRNEND